MKSLQSTKKSVQKKQTISKLTPSQLIKKQMEGNILEELHSKQQIVKFLNLADYSIYTNTVVPVDEPLFDAIPNVLSFTDYEPLQLKEKIFKLRNKDKVARRVKIMQPDSRLFQVLPAPANPKARKRGSQQETYDQNYAGNKIAPGCEACFYIRFSPEAKIDYNYDLVVVTEREQFIVPIYCVGKRAMIDFPDTLDFGNCPVKYMTEKPVIIRNLGEKTTKWFLTLPSGFDADKKEGVLEYGKNEQIVIKFFPTEAKTYKNEAILAYDKLQAFVPVMGIAHNSNVYLSKSFIQMDDAYIGLQTQQTLQIINKSSVKVDFEWRAFATGKEEQEKKNRLRLQLQQEQDEEEMLIKEIVNSEAIQEEFEIEDHDDSDDDQRDEKAILLKRQKKAELMLKRKYKNIRKAIEDDLLLFQDDIFSIEPQQGQIWPNSEMTITITFVPKGALHYSCVAYCNISCSEERLPLTLAGEGIGPKAMLSQNELPIGNKFVNELFETTITFENRGEIECKYERLPNERNFGKMFSFENDRGVLQVGKRQAITVRFKSSSPGEFKETFRFRLEGSTDLESLLCFGHVIAPTFRFSSDWIDFKKVSYRFTSREVISLTNESEVNFTFNLRIPGDEKINEQEFEITPQRDEIKKKETKQIEVKFTPRSAKKYEVVLVVDIEGVGTDMYSLPIKAECQVPTVEIRTKGKIESNKDTLDFGDIFLRDPDTYKIILMNTSNLAAKYEILPQNEESNVLATYKVDNDRGEIGPQKDVEVQVTLTTNKLREITLPLQINIIGANNGIPYIINIIANSIGPKVEVENGLKELDFGSVEVLTDYSQKVTIKNNSKIEADFHAFTKNKVSIFKPIQKHGVMQPGESMDVEIICCCDDANKFQDILHFVIKEGLDIDIVLKAKGRGSTIFCKEDLETVSFGTQYTHRKTTREIFVENKGRKPQKLVWARKPQDKKSRAIENDKKGGDKNKDNEEETFVFDILPNEVQLPPKHGIMFQFTASSVKKGKLNEIFFLNTTVGNERKTNTLYTTSVEGDFIQPTLVFSEKKIHFKYSWEKNVPFSHISKNLEITCGSALPVNFIMKVQPPFSINQEQFQLLPGKSATLRVDFDPGLKLDRVSGEQPGKLQIIHVEHPHREFVDLVGEVCFPNLALETNLINFGSILNDTSKKIIINVENTSEMALYYEWTFVEEELITNQIDQQSEKNSQSSRNSIRENQRNVVPINEVFDILPLSGYLEPGEVEQVEFVYNAFGGQRFKTTAVCHVEGGPQYECTLIGDSSLITYRLSTNTLDLGDIRFCDWVSKDFYIENTGKVTFEYKILYSYVKRKGYIQCTPDYGRIIGGERQKVTIKVCPVMPDAFKEIIMVQVGYFEPEQIVVQGKGYYPAILTSLSRQENPVFKTRFDDEFEKKRIDRENTLKRQQLMAKASEGSKQQQQVGAGVKSLEQIQQEIEKEIDRNFYCDAIQQTLEKREQERLLQTDRLESREGNHVLMNSQVQPLGELKLGNQTLNTTVASKMHAGVEQKLYEKINLTTYICDFGNVVIGKPRKMQFKIQNMGNHTIEFNLDSNSFRQKGYTIVPDRGKLISGDEYTITVSYQAKKNVKFGKNEVNVPLEIKNGAKYTIKLLSNITIPEIFMENIEEFVDFGKVLCGQRKIIYVRLVNDKEITCDWKLLPHREMMADKKKEPLKFSMEPTSGSIPSGQKQIIAINFFPGFEKEYQYKFVLDIDQNPKQFPIVCKGVGASINLEFDPLVAKIGPVLPYDQFSYCILEVKNPSDYDTEMYSTDFDQKYIQDEQILNEYQEFETVDQIYEKVRNPGEDLWPMIQKQVEKKRQIDEIQQKLNDPEQEIPEEERMELQKQYEQLNVVEVKPEYPTKVEDDLLHHVVLFGPTGCGKTDMANQMARTHKRKVFNMADFIDWCLQNNAECTEEIRAELDALQQQKLTIEEERAKLEKKAGKKAVELQEKWGPINENQFFYLSEDLLVKALQERLKHADCNAGIVVDGLESKYYIDEYFGLKVLMRAIGNQSLQFVHLHEQVDSQNLEIWKVIEWEGMEPKQEEEPLPVQQSEEEKKKQKKKPGKNNQGPPKQAPKKKEKKQVEQKVEEPEVPQDLFEIYEPKEWSDEEDNQEEQQENQEDKPPKLTKKQIYQQKLNKFIQIMENKFNEKWVIPEVYDPVFEEGKKEEKKPKKDTKKGKEEPEEPVEVVPETFDYTETLHQGKRIVSDIVYHYNKPQMLKTFLEVIPMPEYPDPNTQPVPEPEFQQIITKPSKGIQREVDPEDEIKKKHFSILTPLENCYAEDLLAIEEQKKLEAEQAEKQRLQEEEEKKRQEAIERGEDPDAPQEEQQDQQQEQKTPQNSKKQPQYDEEVKLQEDKSKKTLKRPQKPTTKKETISTVQSPKQTMKKGKKDPKEEEVKEDEMEFEQQPPKYVFQRDQLTEEKQRWVIPAKKTLLLVVKFFTKSIGQYQAKLNFENFFSLKKYSIDLRAVADFPTISQLPKNIYWNVKKSRPQTQPESYLSKIYISQEKAFDFGPLLIGKNPDNREDMDIKRVNSVTFRISNQGKFDAKLQFDLMSSVMENDPNYKKDIFFLHPKEIEIPKNDVPFELRVWAIPDEARTFKDDVIIMIKDNPQPVILPIHCLGAKPVVDIIEGEPVQFDRLLIGQSDTKQIKLKNNGTIPCKWNLAGIEDLPDEFSLENKFGELKPTQETIIEVSFKALAQQQFNQKITLEVEDLENLGIKQEVKEINIEAEAFDITVDFQFPDGNEDNMLDFGAVRVEEIKDQHYTVKNTGLYKIKFSFNMKNKKKVFRENFTIEPEEMELDPQQEKQILVRFCSQKEVKLNTQRHTTDIVMEILEGKTLELFKPIPINVRVNSVFSKYSVNPMKNLNFGAIQFNESKKLTFEIKNEGLFEFNYNVFNYLNEEFRQELKKQQDEEKEAKRQAALQVDVDPKAKKGAKKDAKDSKKAAKKAGKNDPPEGQIKVGQWTISPSVGTVQPDQSQVIELEFNGNSQKLYEEKLAIDITGRDPEDFPRGIQYDIVGESCIPGINTDSFESIFEEQIIVASQNNSQNIQSMINSNVFFYEEKTFFFGTLVPSKHPDGICEKFKIMNPNKIPCTVKFDVRKRNPNSNENFAFEIGKKEAKIHPHEHVYVKVWFKPTIMAQYSGIFEAIVVNGEQNQKTHKLVFDLRGEGAMPTIKLEKPREYFNESTPMLKFPKVRVDKSVTLPIILKNDGQVPATVKWDLNTNPNFKFIDQNSFSFTPKTYAHFNIQFKPTEPGVQQWTIACQTLLNPYELTKFMIQGEGFYEDIVFENLPNELEDEIDLGDCVINQERKVHFAVKNNSEDPVKFTWNAQGNEDFVLEPRNAHLNGKSTTNVVIKYKSMKTTTYENFALTLETKKIKQANENQFTEWDDSMTNIKYVTQTEYDWYMKRKEEEEQRRKEEEAAAATKKGAKKADKKGKKQDEQKEERPPTPQKGEEACVPYEEPVPEPEHAIIEKTEKNVALKINAISDFARYELDQNEIFFKPTLMYTQRNHTFNVKNTSLIKLKYSCKIILYEDNKPVVDPGYFYISPKNGELAPNCTEQFEVKFSPTEILQNNERFLVISIDNLEPNAEPLVIELDGEAERPICHFELPPSNYREKKPDIDSQYNIIEFESLGTKVKNVKRFYTVNPTATGYEFEWKRVEHDKLPPSANTQNETFFRCITQKGVCLSGKKFEMIFEYTPDIVGTHESYWIFDIPELKLQQYFLIVGSVIEPNIFFDVGKVNFGPLLIGGKNKEVVRLRNLEDIPIPFNFDKSTVLGDPDYADSLSVSPISGVVKPHGDIPIEIIFHPQVESSYNYNLSCNLKRKSRPISLNVKGIGYILNHSVFFSGIPTPLDSSVSHALQLGDIYINEKRSKSIEIENKGEFNFDFTTKKSSNLSSFVQVIPEHGTVKQNESFKIEVKFTPIAEYNLNRLKSSIQVQITSGPSYIFQLFGSARRPGVDFSFYTYDFGPCFVLKKPLPITTNLEVKNRDSGAMSIETVFEKENYLDVNLASGQVIMPLQIETVKDKRGLIQTIEHNILKIPITFTPRESMKYEETITFDINNLYTIDVKVLGEGIPMKLELEKTEDSNIDFGVVRVNKESTKIVTLINYSRKPVNLTFDTDGQLQELNKLFVNIFPQTDFCLNPREKKEIEITFNPKLRLHQFRKELKYKIIENQETRKLLNINGTCHGIELKLMEDTIGFGVVVINSKKQQTVQLSNLGDIGAKYDWDTTYCKKFFTITPSKGYLPPHEDQFFTVTFHPNIIDSDIRFSKVRCNIEGSDPLYVTLLGKSIGQPSDQIQELKFSTIVRTQQIQKVTVKNPSNEQTKIKVSVSSNNQQFKDYFKGKEYLELGPNASADYQITYLPLTMTKNEAVPEIKIEQHEGNLFFPMPDGSALLYNLFGESQPPEPQQVFDISCKAKHTHIQIIPIKNWLKQLQRFKVSWSFEQEDNSVFISGANTFDVAADSTKEYKLSIYGLKLNQNKITVTFKNEKTHEYLHYKINLSVAAPDEQKKILLKSVVRETISKLITIENPLSQPVEIQKEMLSVDSDYISFNPSSFSIPAHSEAGFEIQFRPLLVKEEEAKVQLKSPELGEFIYPLSLQGVASATIQRNMTFKAALGSDIVQSFKFMNYCKKATTYIARVDKLGFKPQPIDPKAKGGKEPVQQIDFIPEQPSQQVAAVERNDGIEVTVNVRFEPSNLGDSQAQLTVQSAEGGEYQCILNGMSTPPQPKGPFKFGGAKNEPIQFKNPFFEAQEFTIRVDNPNFTTTVKSPIKVDGKKPLPIPIAYKAAGGSNQGRLIVSIEKGNYPPWIFYIQGE